MALAPLYRTAGPIIAEQAPALGRLVLPELKRALYGKPSKNSGTTPQPKSKDAPPPYRYQPPQPKLVLPESGPGFGPLLRQLPVFRSSSTAPMPGVGTGVGAFRPQTSRFGLGLGVRGMRGGPGFVPSKPSTGSFAVRFSSTARDSNPIIEIGKKLEGSLTNPTKSNPLYFKISKNPSNPEMEQLFKLAGETPVKFPRGTNTATKVVARNRLVTKIIEQRKSQPPTGIIPSIPISNPVMNAILKQTLVLFNLHLFPKDMDINDIIQLIMTNIEKTKNSTYLNNYLTNLASENNILLDTTEKQLIEDFMALLKTKLQSNLAKGIHKTIEGKMRDIIELYALTNPSGIPLSPELFEAMGELGPVRINYRTILELAHSFGNPLGKKPLSTDEVPFAQILRDNGYTGSCTYGNIHGTTTLTFHDEHAFGFELFVRSVLGIAARRDKLDEYGFTIITLLAAEGANKGRAWLIDAINSILSSTTSAVRAPGNTLSFEYHLREQFTKSHIFNHIDSANKVKVVNAAVKYYSERAEYYTIKMGETFLQINSPDVLYTKPQYAWFGKYDKHSEQLAIIQEETRKLVPQLFHTAGMPLPPTTPVGFSGGDPHPIKETDDLIINAIVDVIAFKPIEEENRNNKNHTNLATNRSPINIEPLLKISKDSLNLGKKIREGISKITYEDILEKSTPYEPSFIASNVQGATNFSNANKTTGVPAHLAKTLADGNCFYSAIFRSAKDLDSFGPIRKFDLDPELNAALDTSLLTKIQRKYPSVDVSDEKRFIRTFRKLIADSIQQKDEENPSAISTLIVNAYDYLKTNFAASKLLSTLGLASFLPKRSGGARYRSYKQRKQALRSKTLKSKREYAASGGDMNAATYATVIQSYPDWFQEEFPDQPALGTLEHFIEKIAEHIQEDRAWAGEIEVRIAQALLHDAGVEVTILNTVFDSEDECVVKFMPKDSLTLYNEGEAHYVYFSPNELQNINAHAYNGIKYNKYAGFVPNSDANREHAILLRMFSVQYPNLDKKYFSKVHIFSLEEEEIFSRSPMDQIYCYPPNSPHYVHLTERHAKMANFLQSPYYYNLNIPNIKQLIYYKCRFKYVSEPTTQYPLPVFAKDNLLKKLNEEYKIFSDIYNKFTKIETIFDQQKLLRYITKLKTFSEGNVLSDDMFPQEGSRYGRFLATEKEEKEATNHRVPQLQGGTHKQPKQPHKTRRYKRYLRRSRKATSRK